MGRECVSRTVLFIKYQFLSLYHIKSLLCIILWSQNALTDATAVVNGQDEENARETHATCWYTARKAVKCVRSFGK